MTISTKSQRITKEPFRREPRYLVVKFTDANKHLTPNERDVLERMSAKCGLGRINEGKRNLNCVVVESDWPEYEPTWKAIEARMTEASPAPSKETIAPTLEDIVCEVLAREAENEDDRQVAKRILRALDREGEAKGADAEHLRELIKRALTYGLNGSDLYDSHEASKVGQEMRAAVCTVTSAPRPPASVDAGTTKETTRAWTDAEALMAAYQMGDASISDVTQKICTLERENAALTAQLSSLAAELKEANADKAAIYDRYHDKDEALKMRYTENLALQAERDSLAVQLEEAKKTLFLEEENRNQLACLGQEVTALRSALAEKEKEAQLWRTLHAAEQNKYASACANMEATSARLAALEEDKRRELLGTGTPWPVESLLKALVVAEAELCRAGRDFDGWESIQTAAKIAQQRLASLSSENPRTLREGEEK